MSRHEAEYSKQYPHSSRVRTSPAIGVANKYQHHRIGGYTLMVAGARTGKTSFLRLLLDTSEIAPSASKEQLAAVAKFVQGCVGHTSHIRSASIDVEIDEEASGIRRQFPLTLIDTPSFDPKDEAGTEHLVSEVLRHIESRFADSHDDEQTIQGGDQHVHLCIYFLDPDHIVPPSVPGLPAPLVHRVRNGNGALSHHTEVEPVILEPPVTTKPLPPNLSPAEISTIRRLSARVNVLPVVARADTLSNDRLAAVKMAIRKDLADAGIGFGIFDVAMDNQYQSLQLPPMNGDASIGHHGTPSGGHSPPASPVVPLMLRLPYALISPDMYSHSDGVARTPPSRHELVLQYTPSPNSPPKLPKAHYVRNFRWGSLDVLNPSHSDFLPLRSAVFLHMETLQNYTRDYLCKRFRMEQPEPHHSLSHHGNSRNHIALLSSRPILAIDTAPHPSRRLPPVEVGTNDSRAPPVVDILPTKSVSSTSKASKQRSKKITVACSFCRSRKLKCDGGRPACAQCIKRSNVCDYQASKRGRWSSRNRKDEESDSESLEEPSEPYEASISPEVASQPLSRRDSNPDKVPPDNLPPTNSFGRQSGSSPPATTLPKLNGSSSGDTRSLFTDNELPQITTMPNHDVSPVTPAPAAALSTIRPASAQQAAQRKRSTTAPTKSNRSLSASGPKIVACNFCRTRKTKCDGGQPACQSCVRRSLPCSYVHEGAYGRGKRRASEVNNNNNNTNNNVNKAASSPLRPDSPPSYHPVQLNQYPQPSTESDPVPLSVDLKRNQDDMETHRAYKKMRVDLPPIASEMR